MKLAESVEDPRLLLEQFAEHTPDVFWMYTADWERLLFINDSYEEIWGRETAALEDDPTDFLEGIHPEYHDMVLADMERLSNGEAIEHEYRVNPEEDYRRWVTSYGEPIYEDGELVRLAGFVREITDQRRTERQIRERERVIRELYDVTADPDLDFEEQVERLLDIGCETLGTTYGTLSEIRGEEYLFDVVRAPDDAVAAGDVIPLSATSCERTASTRETLVLENLTEEAPELAARAGNQDLGIACYVGAPVIANEEISGTFCFYDQRPRPQGFSEWEVTLVDLMSQWVSQEMGRRRTRAEIERQNEQLEAFASIVSHDLRNPLSVLEGSLELAEETGDAEQFERCHRAIGRMQDLIENLLALARSGDRIEETVPVALAEVTDEAWRTVPRSDERIVVETERRIQADPERLRELLENLFRNAVEHGGSQVTVGDLENGFFVADDGPGIPAEDRDQVFDLGYSNAAEGTGVGLKVVADIAAGHDWEVAVTESAEGGAQFEFTGVEAVGTGE